MYFLQKLSLFRLFCSTRPPKPTDDADTAARFSNYDDPLRWSFLPSTGVLLANTLDLAEVENERCHIKAVAMHRPTHDPKLEKTNDYPFAWHFSGRKRLWEIRVQMRLKKLPETPLLFGIELGKYVHVSGVAKQVQKLLVSAIRGVVGSDLYHSVGDDPATTKGEVEPPTFVMPLWCFDQFVVSEPGEEPDIRGDLEGEGIRRTDGLSAYLKAMRQTVDNLSEDKVYTFCIWGISQFLDCMAWEICVPQLFGVKVDFNKLCGAAPVYVGIYELAETSGEDRRHLKSRKDYWMHVAMWSERRPPQPATLQEMGIADAESKDRISRRPGQGKKARGGGGISLLSCCSSRYSDLDVPYAGA